MLKFTVTRRQVGNVDVCVYEKEREREKADGGGEKYYFVGNNSSKTMKAQPPAGLRSFCLLSFRGVRLTPVLIAAGTHHTLSNRL